MKTLVKEFNFNLDKILPNINPHQEKSVYNVDIQLFDNVIYLYIF